jgi:hypothetical protein
MKHGKYEKAFEAAVKKLRKNSSHEKSVIALKDSYNYILTKKYDRIKYLKAQKRDDVWDEIFHIYNRLKFLQEELQTVTPLYLNGKTIDFPYTDYDHEMVVAKKKAADFYASHGKQMLAKGDRFSARKAYKDFTDLKNFFPNYKNVDELLGEAYLKGLSNIVVKVENHSLYNLDKTFTEALLPRNFDKLGDKWQQWHNPPEESFDNFEVRISIENIEISQGLEKEKEYTETKEVEDGWEYELDANGNVKKDSLGNDIKIPKVVILEAIVKKVIQRREGYTHVEITFSDLSTNRRIKKVPANISFFFENRFATVNGDIEAVSKETRKLMRQGPLPFPSDIDMLELSKEPLQRRIENILSDNRQIVN